MDNFENRYYKLHRKLMSFMGFGYTQPYRERVLRYFIISFLLLFRIITQICQLFTLNFDLRSVVPILQSFIPCICFTFLYYNFVINYMTIQKILSYIKEDYRRIKDDIEVKIMKKHAHETNFFTTICACTNKELYFIPAPHSLMFYLYICFSVVPSFLRIILSKNAVMKNTDRFPIFSCYNYFIHRQTYYYCILIYQTIILIVSTTVGFACYAMYFRFIQHICAYFSIIKNEIHRPFININNKDIVPVTPVDLSGWMINVLQQLARTTEYMNLVNALAEQCYLFQILLAFILVAIDFLCLFQVPNLLETKEGRKDMLTFFVFIFVNFFMIYVNCHVGQKVIDRSSAVYQEACMIPIHEISLKTQKLLLTMLILTARPCSLSIGKFFVSSHEFFSDLIGKSLSFSMMLHSMQRS